MLYRKTYNGWVYEYDSENGRFNVNPKDGIEPPPTLFKYYPLSEYSVDALLHNYVYASHPNQLNDYFDCCPQMIVYDNPEIIRNQLTDIGYDCSQYTDDELIKNDDIQREVRKGLWHTMYSKIGIVSFTKDPWNLLMWSHYSQNQGICVEFDYLKFPFDYYGPFPVNYQPSIQEIHLRNTDFRVAVAMQFNIKHERWKYENEWRIIAVAKAGLDMEMFGEPELEKYGGAERKFQYPITAIKNIGLGFSFFSPEELVFSKDYQEAQIMLNPKRSLYEQRRRLLEWICCHGLCVNLALRDGLNDIHYCTTKIVRKGKELMLIIEDKLI